MSCTELPVELWEKIVANLPTPPPKLAPIVIFDIRSGPGPCCVISVSKAISEEERDLISCCDLNKRVIETEWSERKTHWYKACWNKIGMRDMFCSALCLGFTCHEPTDRMLVEKCVEDSIVYMIKK
jgi:hypothetical protein